MSIDEALDQFIAAWHGGMASRIDGWLALVAPGDREELQLLVGTWLEIAPTLEPHPARAAELACDPLVQRLVGLEADGWDARDDT